MHNKKKVILTALIVLQFSEEDFLIILNSQNQKYNTLFLQHKNHYSDYIYKNFITKFYRIILFFKKHLLQKYLIENIFNIIDVFVFYYLNYKVLQQNEEIRWKNYIEFLLIYVVIIKKDKTDKKVLMKNVKKIKKVIFINDIVTSEQIHTMCSLLSLMFLNYSKKKEFFIINELKRKSVMIKIIIKR